MLSLDELERLSRYAAGDLAESERGKVEAEIRTDPDLARALDQCRILDQMLNELAAEPISEQDERLIHRVVRRRLSRRWWWVGAAAAILVITGLGAVVAFRSSSGPLALVARGKVLLFAGARAHPAGEDTLTLDEGGLVVDGQARILANGSILTVNGLAAVTTEPGNAFAHVMRGLQSVPERKDIQMKFSSWSGPQMIVGAASVALLVATGTAEARDPRGETTYVKAGESWSPRTSSRAVVANAQRSQSTPSASASEASAEKRETLREALHKSLPAFIRCYQQGLAQNPSLEGSVIVHATIIAGPDGKGKIAEATIDKDYSIANPFVVSCVLQELGLVTVPSPSDGTNQVTLPIYFRRGDEGQEPSVEIAVSPGPQTVAAPPTQTAQPAQDVVVGNAHARGASNAKVMVVEFSDPECPFCGRAHESIDLLYMELGDRVRFAMKFAPMPFHRRAPTAVAAAFAAGEQGKFWEYVDALFSHPDALDRRGLERMAAQLGLDMKGFSEALGSNRFGAAIEADQNQARKLEVSGVPTLFINGRPLVGARPIEEIRAKILEALKESR
jgi:protein-disulfide isomerase